MVIDFHVHGKITSNFPFDKDGFLEKVNEAKREGMDSLALTEHSNALNFIEAYNFLKNNFEYLNDYYNVNGVKVFTGVEITTNEKLDILFIGNREKILDFNQKILNIKGEQEFICINNLFDIVNQEELLVILAHPFRKHEKFPEIDRNIFEKIDAVEFNARDLYEKDIDNMKEKVKELSKKLNIPITGGSDSHYFLQIGSIKNVFDKDCNTITELKEQIKLNNYKVIISEELTIRVRASKIIKKIIKGKK